MIYRCLSNDCHGTRWELKMYHLRMREIFGWLTNHGGQKDVVGFVYILK